VEKHIPWEDQINYRSSFMDVYNKRVEIPIAGVHSNGILDHIMSSVERELSEGEFPLRFSIFDIKQKKALVNVAVLRK
jgi:hypothetical protein